MKRSTKKAVFLTSMILTFIAMIAFGGRHRFMHHRCGHPSEHNTMMKNDCQRSEHHKHLFHWNDNTPDQEKNKS